MDKKQSNTLSILSLILGIVGLLLSFFFIGIIPCIVALILGIVALAKKQSSGMAVVGIVTSVIGFVVFFCMLLLYSLLSDNDTVQTKEQEIEETTTVPETEYEKSEVPDETASIEFEEPSEYIYYAKLANNYQNYIGERIRTTVPIDDYYNDSIRVNEGIEYAMYIETDTSVLNDAKYATVVGTVSSSGYYVYLKNTQIEYIGNEAPEEYSTMKEAYEEEVIASAISEREAFIESSIEVTYDDLRRYPDTYRGKAIKLTIYFESIEPDGWVFQGDMIATMSGTNDEIAVYDGRTVREPRFLEGDTITVYATGNGLSTMQIKNGTGLLAEVIDEYEIPSIKVLYTDLDNLESVTVADPDDKYEEGREAGEKAAEALNKLFEQ